MRELELKFEVDESFEVPDSWPAETGIATIRELPPQELSARYFDTTDRRLARHHVTLRHRTGDDGGPVWTLKLPVNGDGSARDEIEVQGSPARPPNELRSLVRAFTLAESLRPLATVKTRRRRWALEDAAGQGLAEIARDDVVIVRDRRVVDRFEELELESKGAPAETLESIAAARTDASGATSKHSSKGLRAVGYDETKTSGAPRSRISPREPAGATVRNAIATAFYRLQENDPRARLGSAEGVHQMRVAARHLRSDLQTFAPLVQHDWARGVTEELRWLGGLLGEVRDLDVLRTKLRDAADGLEGSLAPLFDELEERATAARARVIAGLDGDRYVALLDDLARAADDPPLEPEAARPGREILRSLVAGRWKALRRAVEGLEDDAPRERWHKVRIRAKRTRYAAEAIAGSIGSKAGRDALEFARLCSKVQDALGERQDAFVAIATIKGFADDRADDGRLNRAAGRLLERQITSADSAREAFWKQWDRIDRKKNVAWLKTRPGR